MPEALLFQLYRKTYLHRHDEENRLLIYDTSATSIHSCQLINE